MDFCMGNIFTRCPAAQYLYSELATTLISDTSKPCCKSWSVRVAVKVKVKVKVINQLGDAVMKVFRIQN